MLPSNWYENSSCNGCNYGERITAGVFCYKLRGLVPCGYQGCKAQNDFYDDQRKEEMEITLNEFAAELRKTLRFRWLTLDYTGYITLWNNKPKYTADWKGGKKTWQRGNDPLCGMSGYIFPNAVGGALDLEEYADENGNIDYSKCIVEVKE